MGILNLEHYFNLSQLGTSLL